MKRFLKIMALILCLGLLFIPAAAASSVTNLVSNTAVNVDGSCTVQLTVTLHMDRSEADLAFPIPANATDVTLGGAPVTCTPSGHTLLVPLSSIGAGDFVFTITYKLPETVIFEEDSAAISLPLLSGFAYPISAMEFTVTLPSDVDARPNFTSGYHQQGIASSIFTTVTGNTVSGTLRSSLKDHETLVMELAVDPTQFIREAEQEPLFSSWDFLILGCMVLCVIYYCVTLMPTFPKKVRCFSPPDGISAGQIGTCLTGCGTDLTMLVITWAQLGYLHIELSGKDRVLLHKRMDMGNERSNQEMRIFRSLFGSRTTIDGTGSHYANLCRQVGEKSGILRQLYAPHSGNIRIFRLVSCSAGAICGVQMGLSLADGGLGVVLAILFGLICAAFSYFIQSAGKCLPLRDKTPLLTGLGCCALWIGLGFITGNALQAILTALFQLLCGIAAAFGGKRSELGQRCLAQIMGLRSYMMRVSNFELQQRMQKNPEYFYELIPYALALGADKGFARRFGKLPLPENGYLIFRNRPNPTAAQWAAQLRRAADLLNQRQKRLPYEKLLGK